MRPTTTPVIVGRVSTASTGNPSVAAALRSSFTRTYEQRYGTPEPAAIDGYEAMRLTLAAIERATDQGRLDAKRERVVQALLATRHHASPLGYYSVEPDGDTSLNTYDVYHVVDGALKYWKTVRG